MESTLKVKKSKVKKELGFNEWAQKYNVSSLWFADTPEKKAFIERIQLAKYAQMMGMVK
jgi:hypothetical protein